MADSVFETLLRQSHTLLPGVPFLPTWNEDGTDAKAMDVMAAMAAAAAVEADPFGDALGLSPKARTTPKDYLRRTPLTDALPAPEHLSPDGQVFLGTEDGNLYARSTRDGRRELLTSDATPEVDWRFDWSDPALALLGYGTAVTTFSPDSRKLAAYRVDCTGVASLPRIHHLKRNDEVVHHYAAKAGGVLERVTLHLVDLYGRPPVEVELGDTTDTYPVFAGWLPDGSEVLVFEMSRDCRRVDVLAADATTGRTRHLFTEQGETFVRIHHDVYLGRTLGLTLTPAGDGIVFESERTGWNHLYLYDLQGELVAQLTEGDFRVDRVIGFADDHVYLLARTDAARPYDVHVCRVPLTGGALQVLTGDVPGVHSAVLSPTGQAFLDTYAGTTTVPTTVLRTADGTLVREVFRPDTTALEALGLTPPEEFCVKAADGETDLWGLIYKPRDFDPTASYPVIEYVYGGPQMCLVAHGFPLGGLGAVPSALTELGACVVVLDARGTPGRSKAFHDVVVRSWAGHLADDHAEALLQLGATRPYLDLTRVGVNGHSWGGYTSTRLLADRPDVYTAAVSSAPGYDAYASVLYECYLGLPQEPGGRAVYDAANALARAGDVPDGALMIVGGTSDHSTWTEAVKMSQALIEARVDHEFVVLPEQNHAYQLSHDRHHHRKLAQHFAARIGTRLPG